MDFRQTPIGGVSNPLQTQRREHKFLYTSGCIFELTKWLIAVAVILIIIHLWIVSIFIVDGLSMEPNFHNGELIIVNKIGYLSGNPQRGDVAVIKFPGDPEHKKYIKRVMGLPGERLEIKDSKIYINGDPINEFFIDESVKTQPNMSVDIGRDEYFMMGDNRENSNDSRVWGVCPKKDMVGRAWIVLWPPKSAHIEARPEFD